MAPDSYINTYRAYKAGTTKLTTWIIDNACRVHADLKFLPNNAKSNEPTVVPVNHLSKLVRSIVDCKNPKIHIPMAIINVTRTVIDLRNEATDFLARAGKGENSAPKKLRDGHQHFVSVLENVLDILQSSTALSAATNSVKPSSADEAISNMFAALNVEEPVAKDVPATSIKPKKADTRQYDLDATSHDKIFAIFTYFKDLNDIRSYLASVWRDYREGELNLMAAAVTTDTAINLVKRSWHDISQAIAPTSNYPAMASTLMQYVENTGGPVDKMSQWVFLDVASLLASYADVLEPNEVPALKPGYFGVYNPGQDRSKLSSDAKRQEDLIILMEWLPEITKISRAGIHMPVVDELTAGLMEMMEANDMDACPSYAVFGTRIFLDIHHILREHSTRPFEQLQGTGTKSIQFLEDCFRFSRTRSISNWPARNDQVFRNIISYSKEWTQTDVISKLLPSTFRRLGVKSRPYYYLKNHPVLCGLIVFRLNMMLQEGGITLCSAWGSVLYPAHLYNAARHSAGLSSEWADMDYVIKLHSATRMFVGSPPTTPPEYLRRFLLALGASASNFARNRRRPGGGSGALIVESKKGPRGLKSTTPVRDIFAARYVDEGGSARGVAAALTTPNIVAMLSVASRAERTSPTSVDLEAFTREMVVRKQFSVRELLTAVREGVAAEELHLLFDYFGLHQRGVKVMRAVQTHVHADLVKYFGEGYVEDESQLPYVIGYVFEVVRGSDRIAEGLRVQGESRILHEAAEVLERFVAEGENGRQSLMETKALSDTVVRAYFTGALDAMIESQRAN